MSIESAKAYIERMKNDEEFRNKVLACKGSKKRMEFVKNRVSILQKVTLKSS